MSVVEIINKYDALGVQLWVEDGQLRFRAPSGVLAEQRLAELRGHKESLIKYIKATENSIIFPDSANRYAPFPLTDVQAAYLVGRGDIYEFGGVGCHVYMELTMPVIEKTRLEKAWHSLINRHDMLRAVVYPKGYQQVLSDITLPPIKTQDLRGVSPIQAQSAIEQIRAELSTRQYAPDSWPLYELFLTTTDESSILHFSIDMLIADFVSINVMLTELGQLYHQPEKTLPKLEVTFRDLVLFERSQQEQPLKASQKERDRQYWLGRINQMPEAPELPVVAVNKKIQKVSFETYQFRLGRDKWDFLCQQAREQKITPSCAVLSAFAEVIGRWSKQSTFCLNVIVSNRPELHPQINQIVGDFTAVNILEVAPLAKSSFSERAQALQKQLWLDMEHSTFSGIEVLREMNRRRNKSVIIPIVFTSTVGVGDTILQDGEVMRGACLTYRISQTPQVWIDCQVFEQGGELSLNWDVRSGIFPEGMIEDAFAVFEQLLNEMAAGENIWQEQVPLALPLHVKSTRESINSTATPISKGLLQDGFCNTVKHHPDALALVSGGQKFTYQELGDYAVSVQQALLKEGCKKGDIVVVSLDKGVWQVASVLGILLAGGAYLPIDISEPQARRDAILDDSGSGFVLTHGELAEQNWPARVSPINVKQLKLNHGMPLDSVTVSSAQLSYIIYTSGTTGKPKGVMMTHRAVLNTVHDINTRFAVCSTDKILGLANLNFDLSVYDIFGLFAAGGTLILPDAERRTDPSHWTELILEHGITLWNSVPAQMQMLLAHNDSQNALRKSALRLALLSGDWIPPTLPEALADHCPDIKIVSLGGATEAAIWSIFYEITHVPKGANSIPYGTPLANQSFHVLNEQLQPCPDWTTGNLYIGGVGLALGYLGDPQRTSERFIIHPESKERLYHTGDLGRYRPDGFIEFLGREDTQVKIRGHRIELGEIENVLQNHPAISSAVAMVTGKTSLDYRLVAFVEACHLPLANIASEEKEALYEACYQAGERATVSVNRPLLAHWMELADRTALLDMIKTFRDSGLFRDADAQHSLEDIQAAVGVHSKLYRLLRRWLNALCSEKLLQKDVTTGLYSLLSAPLEKDASYHCWQELEQVEQEIHYGAELLRYLRESSAHLPELLRGEVDPLDLFFPQGQLETAFAAYNDNLVNRYLNRVIIEGVVTIAKQHARTSPKRPLRILEIGAGVGGTSVDLITALAGYQVEYLFTDISTFFLNEARPRFAEYPWVSYGLFDINEEYWKQGLTAASWDIIICANVLHNSRHAPTVLSSLKELAVPGGALLIIEATRDIYSLLTSMEFKEGLTGFTDVRAENDQTFFTREQWQEMFSDVKADVVCAYPNKDDYLASAGQTAFITRFLAERVSISSLELKNYLQSQLPEYMVPSQIEVLPQIPLSANGKVDRAALKRRIESISSSALRSGEAPYDDLEKRIADIWAAVLNRETMWRDEDFFSAGGDSLLVAQVVGKMQETLPEAKNWEWDRLMREMLQMPTVAAIGAKLRSQQAVASKASDRAIPKAGTPLIVLAEGKHPDGVMKVFIHTGNGNLAPYRHLLPYFIDAPNRTETIAGLTVADIKTYLSIPPDKLIEHLGQQYAELLLHHGACRFEVIGYCSGGLIAIETAKVLLESGAAVSPVTVISTDRFRYQVKDELLMERGFGRLLGADIHRAGHTVDDALLVSALKEVLTADGVIPPGCLCSLSGPFASVAKCYDQLATKSQSQRLSELGAAIPAAGEEALEYPVSVLHMLYQIFCHSFEAVAAYKPLPFVGDIRMLRVIDQTLHFLPGLQSSSTEFWQELTLGDLQIIDIDGNHLSCLQPPQVSAVANLLISEEINNEVAIDRCFRLRRCGG
jgi:pyochelin synthetase